jgi:hypothetical protein
MNTSQRKSALAVMDYLVVNRGAVHYPINDIRVIEIHTITTLTELHALVQRKGGLPIDCSQTSQVVLQIALGRRIADYDVTTEWFLDNLPRYHDPSAAYVGAACVWGNLPGHHMALVYRRGKTAQTLTMFSNGQESDPRLITLAQETVSQSGRPWTLCSVAKL